MWAPPQDCVLGSIRVPRAQPPFPCREPFAQPDNTGRACLATAPATFHTWRPHLATHLALSVVTVQPSGPLAEQPAPPTPWRLQAPRRLPSPSRGSWADCKSSALNGGQSALVSQPPRTLTGGSRLRGACHTGSQGLLPSRGGHALNTLDVHVSSLRHRWGRTLKGQPKGEKTPKEARSGGRGRAWHPSPHTGLEEGAQWSPCTSPPLSSSLHPPKTLPFLQSLVEGGTWDWEHRSDPVT